MNVRLDGDTVPSVSSLEVKLTVTSASGSVSSTTVNVSVPPASVVLRPEVGSMVIPGASSVRTEMAQFALLPG